MIAPAAILMADIRLGLCCINTALREKDIFCSRTMILRKLQEPGGLDELRRRITRNCQDLITMIRWNEEHGIRFLRMSSEMFPHKSNKAAPSYDFEFVRPILQEAGALARSLGHRLTFHPGQFNVVGTPNEETFAKTVAELDWHAEVLDIMGCDQDSILVVHGGGVYGDKPATIARWAQNFRRLPERVRRRLVLENCEKCYSVVDCLEISRQTEVPVVFDLHHHACYRQLHPAEKLDEPDVYLPAVIETWKRRGIRPKFHISEQRCGGIVGQLSDYITEIPACLFTTGCPIDIAVEAKMKECAIFRLYDRHPQIAPPQYVPKQKRRLIIVKKNIGLNHDG